MHACAHYVRARTFTYPFTVLVLGTYTYQRCPAKNIKRIPAKLNYRLNQCTIGKSILELVIHHIFTVSEVQQPLF